METVSFRERRARSVLEVRLSGAKLLLVHYSQIATSRNIRYAELAGKKRL